MKSKHLAPILILTLVSIVFVSGCVSQEGSKECVTDDDCAVFGKTGDCNSGCYNKDNLPSSTGGECFRAAPVDCKCVNDKCEGIFEGEMSYSEARQIAEQSGCVEESDLTEHARFSGTNNWEIDLEPFIEKEGCNPVCVVDPIERTAEINWRCTGVLSCAKDGEVFSTVSDKYPDQCCEGLKEWLPIPDTRFSIADVCYEVGSPSESGRGLCIECGNGVCENHLNYDENPCNCPEDCAGKGKSMFSSIEEFCQSNDWNLSLSKACEEQETIKDSPICELCA